MIKRHGTEFYKRERGTIYAWNHNEGAAWISAKIVEATGSLSFRCQLADQKIVCKHQDQIWHRDPPTAEQKQEAKVRTREQSTGSEKQDVQVPPPPDSDKQPQPESIQPDDQPTGTAGEVQLQQSKKGSDHWTDRTCSSE